MMIYKNALQSTFHLFSKKSGKYFKAIFLKFQDKSPSALSLPEIVY